MDVTYSAIARFSAGHILSSPPRCARVHGHDYRVAATIAGTPDPMTGLLSGSATLEADLLGVVAEIKDQSLNEMLPGVRPSAQGLAGWLMERLLLGHPNLVQVAVNESDHIEARVMRQIR